MPDQEQFTAHVADVIGQEPVVEVTVPPKAGTTAKHGAKDERLAARQRSERARSSRASSVGSGRSYAFRRS